jgi:hypothetical protein
MTRYDLTPVRNRTQPVLNETVLVLSFNRNILYNSVF